MKSFKFIAFIILVLAQLAVPIWMIAREEMTLQGGQVYRFRTQPVDPYDVFRGRYVALNLEAGAVPTPPELKDQLKTGQQVYVLLQQDQTGFAKLAGLQTQAPATGDYLKLPLQSIGPEVSYVQLPFDRYYLKETDAPAAEAAYRDANNRISPNNQPEKSYITVRVKDGHGVLEELYIKDQPIHEALEKFRSQPQ